MVLLYLSKDKWKGHIRSLKPILVCAIQDSKYGENTFKLDLRGYMNMHVVVNVKNLPLFEPSLWDERVISTILLIVNDLVSNEQAMEDRDLDKKTIMTRNWEKMFFWYVQRANSLSSKMVLYGERKRKFSSLDWQSFWGTKRLFGWEAWS